MAERKQYDYTIPNLNEEFNKVYEVKTELRFRRDYTVSAVFVHGHAAIETGKALATNAGAVEVTVQVTPTQKYTNIIYASGMTVGVNSGFYNVSIDSISKTFVNFIVRRVDAPVASGVFPASGATLIYTLIGAD